MKQFERYRFPIKNYKDADLYFNTTGLAELEKWPSGKIKPIMPNERGYVFVKGEKFNFKRILYKKVYPKINLKNKVVISIKGQNFNAANLVAITRNELVNLKRHNKDVSKNYISGECKIC